MKCRTPQQPVEDSRELKRIWRKDFAANTPCWLRSIWCLGGSTDWWAGPVSLAGISHPLGECPTQLRHTINQRSSAWIREDLRHGVAAPTRARQTAARRSGMSLQNSRMANRVCIITPARTQSSCPVLVRLLQVPLCAAAQHHEMLHGYGHLRMPTFVNRNAHSSPTQERSRSQPAAAARFLQRVSYSCR